MIALMAKGLHQPPEVIVEGITYVEPRAQVAVGILQRMLDWYERQGMQKSHIDATSLIDMRYAKLSAEP